VDYFKEFFNYFSNKSESQTSYKQKTFLNGLSREFRLHPLRTTSRAFGLLSGVSVGAVVLNDKYQSYLELKMKNSTIGEFKAIPFLNEEQKLKYELAYFKFLFKEKQLLVKPCETEFSRLKSLQQNTKAFYEYSEILINEKEEELKSPCLDEDREMKILELRKKSRELLYKNDLSRETNLIETSKSYDSLDSDS
jgi:hypothetical protein